MNSSNNFGFFAKEVALKLEITPSTLRQWALALEENGYQFERNDKKQRIYYDHDIIALLELKRLIEKSRNRDDAIKAIAKAYKERKNAEKTLSVIEDNGDTITFTKDEFESILNKKINEIIAEAVNTAFEKGKEQGREEMKVVLHKIDERIEKRDNILMELLRSTQEQTQKQIAAAQEENKKGFWGRFFGK